jgi:hypothetical protein
MCIIGLQPSVMVWADIDRDVYSMQCAACGVQHAVCGGQWVTTRGLEVIGQGMLGD